ncbi:YbdD/YjiX family protein [Actinotignum urinale]|uniref:YbdD/YjiX family protein n=1 Tax=Actinotignum urinale TaxID=190146 RepID=A0AAW9HVA2_9ACTO|nr:YbdD/YjiX family protein [Actinotignum urinale]MDY5133753.1 YbdD/YjiX family protein [Actinotignum urinale]MDY5151767.1 YbdD/YjiX family protein [Actinotignum urinale]MDY5154345.1 YbdD/YjiX family protein [Actinotignum urinale]MDY5160361.1 YbdD/YjiX family protein [Actinotignum urinale]WIK59755.1 YbdD/YjiX family protein [Actinotignum urinale]
MKEKLHKAKCMWRDMTGESLYDRYLIRHKREHPNEKPMTKREFWKSRSEYDAENINASCC